MHDVRVRGEDNRWAPQTKIKNRWTGFVWLSGEMEVFVAFARDTNLRDSNPHGLFSARKKYLPDSKHHVQCFCLCIETFQKPFGDAAF